MSDFYVANKLLSLLDMHGRKPELYFCCGNRTAGKTFFFKRWFLRRFVKYSEKFIIFVRFIDDIANTSAGFFADIGPIAFPGHEFGQRPILHGKAAELLYDKRPCGYIIALNDPERIKRNSALFADATRGFLDEFMSENGKYCSNEVFKFNSIRLSIARGGAKGTHARYFPVYLCSNNVTISNPYFDYLGIALRLQNNTKYLKGDGWVLEQTFNRAAADAINDNFRTISEDERAYAASNEYLLDTKAFVRKLPGGKTCMCKIRYNGKTYGVWGTEKSGLWYISSKLQSNTRFVLSLSSDDHDEDSILMPKSHPIFKMLVKLYANGNIRFESQAAKNALLDALRLRTLGK